MCDFQFPELSVADLEQSYIELSQLNYMDVSGVRHIKGKDDGPVLGITVMTHGNEPSGLYAYYYLMNILRLEETLKKGSVVFCLNNITAADRFFQNVRAGVDTSNDRYIDFDMNRITDANLRCGGKEARRINALTPIWNSFDIGLDIHSTPTDSMPMVIAPARSDLNMLKNVPIETIIQNIDAVQSGKAASDLYGAGEIPVFGFETGSHMQASGFRYAADICLNLLSNLEMIEYVSQNTVASQKVYKVVDALSYEGDDLLMARVFKNLEPVSIAETLAVAGDQKIKSPIDGHILFPPATIKPPKTVSEIYFIAELAVSNVF